MIFKEDSFRCGFRAGKAQTLKEVVELVEIHIESGWDLDELLEDFQKRLVAAKTDEEGKGD